MEAQHKAKEGALITKGEFPFLLFIKIACFRVLEILIAVLRFGYQITNGVKKDFRSSNILTLNCWKWCLNFKAAVKKWK